MKNETEDCVPPAINQFPPDGLTHEQRAQGWIAIHFLVCFYIFIGLAIVCDEYFVPAVVKISQVFEMSSDVAGATVMAVATSAPEFFINMIGTFITEGDIGIGTIVGSAVFNMLGVAAVCGLFSGVTIQLDWWPLTRDSVVYSFAVISLIHIMSDEFVHWYEALYLCILYFFYLLIMYNNTRISKCVRALRICKFLCITRTEDIKSDSFAEEDDNIIDHLIEFPFKQSCFTIICWTIQWPLYAVFFLTIPDCRIPRLAKCFGLSFIMCTIWIAVLTYLISWSLTIIGETFKIPDSVMGITVIAIGTSIPEAVSSINVAKRGHGSMAICNSVGSNTFDILICLGVPWLIKSYFYASEPGGDCLRINSTGLIFSLATLLGSIVLLNFSFMITHFTLGKGVGYICLFLYMGFLVFATLMEMNYFFKVNSPTCPH